jgi:hypothetical protein
VKKRSKKSEVKFDDYEFITLKVKVKVYYDPDNKIRAYLDIEDFQKALEKKYGK